MPLEQILPLKDRNLYMYSKKMILHVSVETRKFIITLWYLSADGKSVKTAFDFIQSTNLGIWVL